MNITFVYGGFENLGVEYLSASLKKAGHSVSLVYSPKLFDDTMLEIKQFAGIFTHYDNLAKRVIASKPEIVAFSVVTDDFIWALKIARKIKKIDPNIKTIFGGIHVTSVPKNVIKQKEVDYLCVGEGEHAIVDFANAYENGEDISCIPNIWGKTEKSYFQNSPRPLIQDLDSLPFPDKQLFYDAAPYHSYVYTLMASRGCSLNCPYCHHNVERRVYKGLGKYFRVRSVESVILELENAKRKWNIKRVMFEDDMLLDNREWILELCKEYKKRIGVQFMMIGHPTQVDDEMAKALSDAGCKYIEIGVQTFNELVKHDILKRPEYNKDVISHLLLLKKYGIKFNVDQLAGLPCDREEDLVYSAKVYNYLRPNRIYFLFLTYYPETEMCNIVSDLGYATDDEIEKVMEGKGESTVQRGSVTREIFSEFRFLYGYLPLLPKWVVHKIIKYKLYKHLPKYIPLCTNVPDSLGALFYKSIEDFRGPLIIWKYVYHFFRMGF